MRIALSLMLLAAVGCKKPEQSPPQPASQPAAAKTKKPPANVKPISKMPTATRAATEGKNQPVAVPDGEQKPDQPDRGALKLSYKGADSKTRAMVRESGIFETVSAELDHALRLPRDIPVVFADCGEENAFYDPEAVSITMCNEYVDFYGKLFAEYDKNEARDAIVGALISVYLHEMGHALIHQLGLPAVGREEDAADQLSAVVLVASGDEGEKMATEGAEAFVAEAENEQDTTPYWDAHALNEQRFYNVMCLIYGSNPDKFEDLVSDKQLPEERAESCPDEYKQISGSWNRLLKPYLSVPVMRMTLSEKRRPK